MESVTLETLWESNLQVIVFYHSEFATENHQFWPGNYIPSPWPNVCNISKMLQFLSTNYARGRPQGTFYVTQGILTADTGFLIKHFMSSLRNMLCGKVVKPFVDWLQAKKAGANGINICIMDFIEDNDYITTVIALNNTL